MTSNNKAPRYLVKLIAYAMQKRGWSPDQTAEAAGISRPSVDAALAGKLKTTTKLGPLADALGITWKCLFDVDMPESQFHRAVTNGKRG